VTRAAVALVAALAVSACGSSRTVVVAPTASAITRTPVQQLQADLSAIFETPQFERSFWSVLVRPGASNDDLYSLNAAKLMMPGSAMKIVTVAAAAELLGWDHQFETKVVSVAPVDQGVLRGDLVVIGGGDPSISERSDTPGTLLAIARRLHDAGITRVEGGVIGDDDLFDDNGFGDGWTLDNLPYGYAAAVSALEYNEGSVDLVIRAGAAAGDPVTIQVRPGGSGVQIDNQLVTVAESGTGRLTLHRLPGSSRVVVRGQIPAKAAPFARTASVDNPTAFFVSAFREALIAEGIQVNGDAVDIDDFLAKPDLSAARTLVSHKSPPLRQLAASMMKVSQNQYAEMLLRSLGASSEMGASSTLDAPGALGGLGMLSALRMRGVLKGWNIADDSYVIADGSGLSRYNYVTSSALVGILQRMRAEPKHAAAFAETLPVTGRGTLSKRLAGTAAEGRVRAKTGTVDKVRAIAGYVDTASGETLVFSIIANNFTVPTSTIDAAADRALVRLATFTR
jgi:D-alanyl-D-alanine carboxypeptidase/D-alanyl-D-alanine-endopeptidase (penicillin-binding protein 4)